MTGLADLPAVEPQAEAHDEQLGVWADELMNDLVLNSLMDLVDHDYDTKVGARMAIIAALKQANQAKVPKPDDEPECTCCGGTGITYQTERRCACQPTLPDDVAEVVEEAGRLEPEIRKLAWSSAHETADTIRSLIAIITAQAARIENMIDADTVDEMLDSAQPIMAEACRGYEETIANLETALAAMTNERDELATANHRQASCIHVTAANLGPDCSATVDGLPKAARHVVAERDALLGAVKGLVEVLDQHETKGPLPDTALMFCWLAAQNVRAVLRGYMLETPE